MAQLDGTGHIGRFVKILELPVEVRHVVDWGSGNGCIGFTAAVELAKLRSAADQRTVGEAVLSGGLTSREVRQIAQLRRRSGREIGACVAEVVGMRPRIEKRYVFVGANGPELVSGLEGLSQVQRDRIFGGVISKLGMSGATGRLGLRFFTLVGGECFEEAGGQTSKMGIETQIRSYISEALRESSSVD